jgi:hypothetical protein
MMSTTERAKRSRAMKAFHARRREANESRSYTLRDYWEFSEEAIAHRAKLSRAMKRWWRANR